MPNKRRSRQQVHHFNCPFCQKRLWRANGLKYHLYYQGKSEIKENLNITSKKASFIVSYHPVYVDPNVWIEEFFCQEEQKQIWLRVFKMADGQIESKLATQKDWERAVRTPDPDFPNSTVSEFTYRMSYRMGQQVAHYQV